MKTIWLIGVHQRSSAADNVFGSKRDEGLPWL
jgi:hypothetical protein